MPKIQLGEFSKNLLFPLGMGFFGIINVLASTFLSKEYTVDGTKIQFGISSYQNDYLTFTLAKKDNYFLHVKDHPGPHVIIYSNNPSKETILFACEIALFYASLSEGEVYLADKKDVKKIPGKLGKVSMNRYETITLNSIRDSSKNLFSKINTIK